MILIYRKYPIHYKFYVLQLCCFVVSLHGAALDENGLSQADNKTLGMFLKTKFSWQKSEHVYINRDLRKEIATFAHPISSHEVPIDFITHATIIPHPNSTKNY